MNLTLVRKKFLAEGIFGELSDESGKLIAATLEHSYSCVPKLYDGVFTCVRGQHQLAHMSAPFETFEITGVIGHTDILFHVGNYNDDSEGCVLLGGAYTGTMITGSRTAFEAFMQLQTGVDNFTLTVKTQS